VSDRSDKPAWLVWLGWTLLYALVVAGGLAVTYAWGRDPTVPYLLAYGLALGIGLLYRTWWWVLVPPLVVGGVWSMVLIAECRTVDCTAWILLLVPLAAVFLFIPALLAWGGVVLGTEWRERR
jgi:hypothetical protein